MFDYEEIAIHWVNRLGFLTRKELSARFHQADHSISPEEWSLLLVLWKKGPQSPGALADVTIKDRTTVTRLLDGMVRKGLVTREEDPRDRRRSVVAVTPAGQEQKHELIRIAQGLIADALADIPAEDVTITIKTLKKMTENLLPESLHVNESKENQDATL
ncbi:MarR family winged helix-turn-helix transcriptional regulator [Thalassospira alkalitolerans]|uniref:MarR family winged helix-turn-helix transcriptional regulator n=1 Tax=Thalassospira alkalitolerans TaxID=1293890 RepID=UPI003AA7FEF3